ncbi:hypothetical protein UFOVP964_102 [uncultured Caudovirales phage]|uniref:Uncharacterized protein n=1 Tax=uncultured Caudovirales phage TaxID=2100421 RepID=A0A6J5Q5D7_9CAUD|nr:hypothetical protein UFOVP854_102 [uncultured Caudovirales phage]CAB4174949.1 hypothetical protein UFOVP964_102 [uncultured Caudovirales phage]CAB4179283.1 hypothetical protein UFOVP1034_56 [uncultured Caudovirales phage]CAB4189100.1 hypothetical protein UFOVP1177_56 [uncultured Caudovirales phage]CAB4193230.1 hypothetical protein UFOVP1243_43 [uncultured Caudovirales phage]
MRNFFKKVELPDTDSLLTSLLIATDFLNPDMEKEDVLYSVMELLANALGDNKLALVTNDVCKSAQSKFDEVKSLYTQFQLTTDINN